MCRNEEKLIEELKRYFSMKEGKYNFFNIYFICENFEPSILKGLAFGSEI